MLARRWRHSALKNRTWRTSLDCYLDKSVALGLDEAYQRARKELPAEAGLLVLVDVTKTWLFQLMDMPLRLVGNFARRDLSPRSAMTGGVARQFAEALLASRFAEGYNGVVHRRVGY